MTSRDCEQHVTLIATDKDVWNRFLKFSFGFGSVFEKL